jgi:hypothetical protein
MTQMFVYGIAAIVVSVGAACSPGSGALPMRCGRLGRKVSGAIGHGWAPEREQSYAVGPVQFVVVHFFPSRGFQWKHMGHQNLSPLRSPDITSVRVAEDCC